MVWCAFCNIVCVASLEVESTSRLDCLEVANLSILPSLEIEIEVASLASLEVES